LGTPAGLSGDCKFDWLDYVCSRRRSLEELSYRVFGLQNSVVLRPAGLA